MAEGFAAIPTWMIRDTRIPRNALLVYAALASRSGYREIYPSQETIAEESGLGLRTVRNMIRELVELGVISRERRKVAGEKRAPDGYRLHPNGLPADSAGSSDLPASGDRSTGTRQQGTPSYTDRESEIENPLTPKGKFDLEALFDEAWEYWPKKTERKDSLAKFKVKVREHFPSAPGELVEHVLRFGQAYAATTETKFVPALCVWLNRERWTDPLPERARSGQQGTAAERMIQQLTAEAAQSTDWSDRGIGQ